MHLACDLWDMSEWACAARVARDLGLMGCVRVSWGRCATSSRLVANVT